MDSIIDHIVTDKANIIGSKVNIIGLYFSGEYCKYCKEFTPMLISAYPQLLANNIDIVYISSDKSIDQYESYRSTQPWQALPYGETELRANLREQFNIKTIPALLFFDVAQSSLIEANGRNMIRDDCGGTIKALIGSIISGYDSDASDF